MEGHSINFDKQFRFLAELDKLKSVYRQSPLVDRTRKENSAEHSWHLAMFALVFANEAPKAVDPLRLVAMLLVHDIVEIDAGDVPIHSQDQNKSAQEKAEQVAAERLFGLLPPTQAQEFLSLWQEFERGQSETAKFAKALDRLQPLFLNTLTNGGTWTENRVTEEQALNRYGPTIERGSAVLWREALKRVRQHFSTT